MSLPVPASAASSALVRPSSRISRSTIAALCLFMLVLIGLSLLLISLRVEHVLLELAEERAVNQGRQIQEQVDEAYRLGVVLQDMTHLSRFIEQKRAEDNSLAAVAILSGSDEVVKGLNPDIVTRLVNPVWSAQLLGRHGPAQDRASHVVSAYAVTGLPIIDASGNRAGVIWLVHNHQMVHQQTLTLIGRLAPMAALLMIVLLVVTILYCRNLIRASRLRLEKTASLLETVPDSESTENVLSAATHSTTFSCDRVARIFWRGAVLASVIFCVGFIALLWQARASAKEFVLAQLKENAVAVGGHLGGQITRALELGVPFEKLTGVDAVFSEAMKQSREVSFIALQNRDGKTLVFQGAGVSDGTDEVRSDRDNPALKSHSITFSFPVAAGTDAGTVVIGYPENYVDQHLGSIVIDQIIALIIALVMVSELARLVWVHSAFKPLAEFELWFRDRIRMGKATVGNAKRKLQLWKEELGLQESVSSADDRDRSLSDLAKVRLLVFLVALSEELLRPIIAVFAAEVKPLSDTLSVTMLAGLPIAAFMTTLAFAQPLGVWLSRLIDLRKGMAAVGILGALLMAATVYAGGGLALLLLRGGIGVAYGLMLIMAQTAIVQLTDSKGRARGLVEVSAAIVAAGIVGPAFGGIIAERFGHLPTFLASASCYLMAVAVAISLPVLAASGHAGAGARFAGARGFLTVLRQRQALAVIFFVAIPARLAAAALLNILVPLYLLDAGSSVTTTGRVLLLYFLAFLLAAPFVARWSDRSGKRKPYVYAGCVLSVIACGIMAVADGAVAVGACCFLLGLAQALLSAPQLAIVTEIFERQQTDQIAGKALAGQALGAFRLLERVGSIAAPFVAAAAVGLFGLGGSVVAIGVLLAIGVAGVAIGLANYKEAEMKGAA